MHESEADYANEKGLADSAGDPPVTVLPDGRTTTEAMEEIPMKATPANPEAVVTFGLAARLSHAQSLIPDNVPKDGWNSFHGYHYTTAETMFQAAKDAMTAAGLVLIPKEWTVISINSRVVVEGVEIDEETHTLHRDYLLMGGGETMPLSISWPVIPEKGRPLDKALASALTSSHAYFLRDLLLIPRMDASTEMDHESRGEAETKAPRVRGGGGGRKAEDKSALISDVEDALQGVVPDWSGQTINFGKPKREDTGWTWDSVFEVKDAFQWAKAVVDMAKRDLEKEEKDPGSMANYSPQALRCAAMVAVKNATDKLKKDGAGIDEPTHTVTVENQVDGVQYAPDPDAPGGDMEKGTQ